LRRQVPLRKGLIILFRRLVRDGHRVSGRRARQIAQQYAILSGVPEKPYTLLGIWFFCYIRKDSNLEKASGVFVKNYLELFLNSS